MPAMFKKPSPPFHFEIERRLMDYNTLKTNIVAPRGGAKSSLACICTTLHHIFAEDTYRRVRGLPLRGDGHKREPAYVLIISKTERDATQRMRQIKGVIGDKKAGFSPQFRALYGNWGEDTARSWQSQQIILKDGSSIRCLGTGQNVHGLNEGNVRPTLVIVDDPEDKKNTVNVEMMAKNMQWLYESIIPGIYPELGRLVVIGTPLNTGCMVVKLHRTWSSKKSPDSDSIWFRQSLSREEHEYSVLEQNITRNMRLNEDKWGYWDVKPGLIWPEQLSKRALEAHKYECQNTEGVGVGVYYRQYECQIRGDGESVFEDDWFDQTWEGSLVRDAIGRSFLRIYRRGKEEFDDPLMLHVGVTTGYDPAYSVESESSYTAIANIATDSDGYRYELPWVYDKFEATRTIDVFIDNQRHYMPKRSYCEANGPQKAFYDICRQRGLRAMKDHSAMRIGKLARISTLSHPMSGGKYFFQRNSPAREEGLDFPSGSMDYLDALEKAERCRIKGKKNITFIKGDIVRSPKGISNSWLTA